MQIKAVDHNNDLYAVSDVFESELLKRLHDTQLLDYKWQKENMQEDLLRRNLKYSKDDILHDLDRQINDKEHLQQFSDILGEKVYGLSRNFWLDLPGYTIFMA